MNCIQSLIETSLIVQFIWTFYGTILKITHSVLLIDDHALLRQSLVQTLAEAFCKSGASQNTHIDFSFYEAGNGNDAIALVKQNPQIDTLLLDLDIGGENGLDVLKAIRVIRPKIKTLVLSMHTEPLKIQEACNANIQGYVSKDVDLPTLANAVLAVAQGELYFTGTALKILQKGYIAAKNLVSAEQNTENIFALYSLLSRKEQELFVLFARGMSIKEAATHLGKSTKTVDNQRTAIYQKLNIHDNHGIEDVAQMLGIG